MSRHTFVENGKQTRDELRALNTTGILASRDTDCRERTVGNVGSFSFTRRHTAHNVLLTVALAMLFVFAFCGVVFSDAIWSQTETALIEQLTDTVEQAVLPSEQLDTSAVDTISDFGSDSAPANVAYAGTESGGFNTGYLVTKSNFSSGSFNESWTLTNCNYYAWSCYGQNSGSTGGSGNVASGGSSLEWDQSGNVIIGQDKACSFTGYIELKGNMLAFINSGYATVAFSASQSVPDGNSYTTKGVKVSIVTSIGGIENAAGRSWNSSYQTGGTHSIDVGEASRSTAYIRVSTYAYFNPNWSSSRFRVQWTNPTITISSRDTTLPSITINNPVSNNYAATAWSQDSRGITISAYDKGLLKTVHWGFSGTNNSASASYNNALLAQTMNGGNVLSTTMSAVSVTVTPGSGDKYLFVRAVDISGKTSYSSLEVRPQLKIDDVQPTVSAASIKKESNFYPYSTDVWSNKVVNLSITCGSDNISGVKWFYEYTPINGTAQTPVQFSSVAAITSGTGTNTTSGVAKTYDFPNGTNGSYKLWLESGSGKRVYITTITATSVSTNASSGNAITVKVDTETPVATMYQTHNTYYSNVPGATNVERVVNSANWSTSAVFLALFYKTTMLGTTQQTNKYNISGAYYRLLDVNGNVVVEEAALGNYNTVASIKNFGNGTDAKYTLQWYSGAQKAAGLYQVANQYVKDFYVRVDTVKPYSTFTSFGGEGGGLQDFEHSWFTSGNSWNMKLNYSKADNFESTYGTVASTVNGMAGIRYRMYNLSRLSDNALFTSGNPIQNGVGVRAIDLSALESYYTSANSADANYIGKFVYTPDATPFNTFAGAGYITVDFSMDGKAKLQDKPITGARRIDVWVEDQAGNESIIYDGETIIGGMLSYIVYWDPNSYTITLSEIESSKDYGTIKITHKNDVQLTTSADSGNYKRGERIRITTTATNSAYAINQVKLTLDGDSNKYSIYGGIATPDANAWDGSSSSTLYYTARKLYAYNSTTTLWTTEEYTMNVGPMSINASTVEVNLDAFASYEASYRAVAEITRADTNTRYYNGKAQGVFISLDLKTGDAALENWTSDIVSKTQVTYVGYNNSALTLKWGNGEEKSPYLTAVHSSIVESGTYGYSAQICSPTLISNQLDGNFVIEKRTLALTVASGMRTGSASNYTYINSKEYGSVNDWLWNGTGFTIGANDYADPQIQFTYTMAAYSLSSTYDSKIVYNGNRITISELSRNGNYGNFDSTITNDAGTAIIPVQYCGLSREGAGASGDNGAGNYSITRGNFNMAVGGAADKITNSFDITMNTTQFVIYKRDIEIDISLSGDYFRRQYDESLQAEEKYVIISTSDVTPPASIYTIRSGYSLVYGDSLSFSLEAIYGSNAMFGTRNWDAGLYAVRVDTEFENYNLLNQYVDETSGYTAAVLHGEFFQIYSDMLFVRPVANQYRQFGAEEPYSADYNIYTDSIFTSVNNIYKGNLVRINDKSVARFVREAGEDLGSYRYNMAIGFFYGTDVLKNIPSVRIATSPLVLSAGYVMSNGMLQINTQAQPSGTVYTNYTEYTVNSDMGRQLLTAAQYLSNHGLTFDVNNAFLFVNSYGSIVPYSSALHETAINDGYVYYYCPNYLLNTDLGLAANYDYDIVMRDENSSGTTIDVMTGQRKTYGDTASEAMNWAFWAGALSNRNMFISAFGAVSGSTSTNYTFAVELANGSAITRALKLPSQYSGTYSVTFTSQVNGEPKTISVTKDDWITYELAQIFKAHGTSAGYTSKLGSNLPFDKLFEQAGTYYIVPSVDYGESINWDGFVYGYYASVSPSSSLLVNAGNADIKTFKLSFRATIYSSGEPNIATLKTYTINQKSITMSVYSGQNYFYGDTDFTASGNAIVSHSINGFISNGDLGISDISYVQLALSDERVGYWAAYNDTESPYFRDNDRIKTKFGDGLILMYTQDENENYVVWDGLMSSLYLDRVFAASLGSGVLSGKLASSSSQAGTCTVSATSYTVSANYRLNYDIATYLVINKRQVYLNFFEVGFANGKTDNQLLTTHFASNANRLTKVYDGTSSISQTNYKVVADFTNLLGNAHSGLAAVDAARIASTSQPNFINLGYSIVVNGYEASLSGNAYVARVTFSGAVNNNYEVILPQVVYLTITPKTINVNQSVGGSSDWINIANKVYNGNTEASVTLTDGASSGELCSGGTDVSFSMVSAKFAQADVNATGSILRAVDVYVEFEISGADAGNYTVATYVGSATIMRKTIDVTVGNVSTEFGNEPVYTAGYSGWVGLDTMNTLIAANAGYSAYFYTTQEGGGTANYTELYDGLLGKIAAGTPLSTDEQAFIPTDHSGSYYSQHVINFAISDGTETYNNLGNYYFNFAVGELRITKKTVTIQLASSKVSIADFAAFADNEAVTTALGMEIVPYPDPNGTIFAAVTSAVSDYSVSYNTQDGTPTDFATIKTAAGGGNGGMYNIAIAIAGATNQYFQGGATLFFSVGDYQEVAIQFSSNNAVYTGAEVDFSQLLTYSFIDEGGQAQTLVGYDWVFGGTFTGTSSGDFSTSGPINAGTYSVTMNASYKPTSAVTINGYNYDGFYGNLPSGVVNILKTDAIVVAENVTKVYGQEDPILDHTIYTGYAFYPFDEADLNSGSLSDIYAKKADGKYYAVVYDGAYKVVEGDNNAVAFDASVHSLFKLTANVKNYESTPDTNYASPVGNLSRAQSTNQHTGAYAIGVGTVGFAGTSFAYVNHNLWLSSDIVTSFEGGRTEFSADGQAIENPATVSYLTITPKTVTVTVIAGSKIYDNTSNAIIAYRTSGYVTAYGDSDSFLSIDFFIRRRVEITDEQKSQAELEGHTVLGEAGSYYYYVEATTAGAYDVCYDAASAVCNQAGEDDYVLSIDDSACIDAFTIRRKVVTVTVLAYSSYKFYGDPDPHFEYSYNAGDLIAGDGASFSGAISRMTGPTGENVGTYGFTIGTLALSSNYEIALNVSGVFTIRKAMLTVSQNDFTKKYYELAPTAYSQVTYTYTDSVSGNDTTVSHRINDSANPNMLVLNVRGFKSQADAIAIFEALDQYTLSLNYSVSSARTLTVGSYANALRANFTTNNGNTNYSNSNYNIQYEYSSMTVTPVSIVLTAMSSRYIKTYGSLDLNSLFRIEEQGTLNALSLSSNALPFTVVVDSASAELLKSNTFIYGVLSRPANENVGTYPVSIGSVHIAVNNTSQKESVSPNFLLSMNSFSFTITPKAVTIKVDGDTSVNSLTKQYGSYTPVIKPTGEGWVYGQQMYSAAYSGSTYINDTNNSCIVENSGLYQYYYGAQADYRFAPPSREGYPIEVVKNFVVSANYNPTTVNTNSRTNSQALFVITQRILEIDDADIPDIFKARSKTYDGTANVLEGDAWVDYSSFDLVTNVVRDRITIGFHAEYNTVNAGLTTVALSGIGLVNTEGDKSHCYELRYYSPTIGSVGLAEYGSSNPTFEFTIDKDNLGQDLRINEYRIDYDKNDVMLIPRQYDGTTKAAIRTYIDEATGYEFLAIGIPDFIQRVVAANAASADYSIDVDAYYLNKNVSNNAQAVLSISIKMPNASNNFIVGSVTLSAGEVFAIVGDTITIELSSNIYGVIAYRDLMLSAFTAIDKNYDNTSDANFVYTLDNIVRLYDGTNYFYEDVYLTFGGDFVVVDDFGNVSITTDVGVHSVLLREQTAGGDYFLLSGTDKGNYRLMLTEYSYALSTDEQYEAGEELYTWEYAPVYTKATEEQSLSLDEIYSRDTNGSYSRIRNVDNLFAQTSVATEAQLQAGLNLFAYDGVVYARYDASLHSEGYAIHYCIFNDNLYHRTVRYNWTEYDESKDYTSSMSLEQSIESSKFYVIFNGEFIQYIEGEEDQFIGSTVYYKYSQNVYSNPTASQRSTGVNLVVKTFAGFEAGATDNAIADGTSVYVKYDEFYAVSNNTQLQDSEKLFVRVGEEWVQYNSTIHDGLQICYRYTDHYVLYSQYLAGVLEGNSEPQSVEGNVSLFTYVERYVPYDFEFHGGLTVQGNATVVVVAVEDVAVTYSVYYEQKLSTFYSVASNEQIAAGTSLYVKYTNDYHVATADEIARGVYLYTRVGDSEPYTYEKYIPGTVATIYYFERERYVSYDASNPEHLTMAKYYKNNNTYYGTAYSVGYPACAILHAEIHTVNLDIIAEVEDKVYDASNIGTIKADSEEIFNTQSDVQGQGYLYFKLDRTAAIARFFGKDVAYDLNKVVSQDVALTNLSLYMNIDIDDLLTGTQTVQSLLTDGYVNYAYFPLFLRSATSEEVADTANDLYFFKEEYYREANLNVITEYIELGKPLYVYENGEFTLRKSYMPLSSDKQIYYVEEDVYVRYYDGDGNVNPQFDPLNDIVFYGYLNIYVPYSVLNNRYSLHLPNGYTEELTMEEFTYRIGNERYVLCAETNGQISELTSYSYAVDGTKNLTFKSYGNDISNYVYNTQAVVTAKITPKPIALNNANAHILDKVYDKSYDGSMIFKAEQDEAQDYYTKLISYLRSKAETVGDISDFSKFSYAVTAASNANWVGFNPKGVLYTVDQSGIAQPLNAQLFGFNEGKYNSLMNAVIANRELEGLETVFGSEIYTYTDTLLDGVYSGETKTYGYLSDAELSLFYENLINYLAIDLNGDIWSYDAFLDTVEVAESLNWEGLVSEFQVFVKVSNLFVPVTEYLGTMTQAQYGKFIYSARVFKAISDASLDGIEDENDELEEPDANDICRNLEAAFESVAYRSYDADIVSATYSVEFQSSQANNNQPVEIKVTGLSGSGSKNYMTDDSINISATGNILKKELTISSAAVRNKIYDGTSVTTVGDIILTGIISGDIVTVSNMFSAYLASMTMQEGVAVFTPATQFGNSYYGIINNVSLTGRASNNYTLKVVDNFVLRDGTNSFIVVASYAETYNNTYSITPRELSVSRWAQDKDYDGTSAIEFGKYGYSLGNVVDSEKIESTNAYTIALAYDTYQVGDTTLNKVFFTNSNASYFAPISVEMSFINAVYNMTAVASSAVFDPAERYFKLSRNSLNGTYEYVEQRGLTQGIFDRDKATSVFYVRGSVNNNYKLKASDVVNATASAKINPLNVTATASDIEGVFGKESALRVDYSIQNTVKYYELEGRYYTMAYATANGFADLLDGITPIEERFDTAENRARIANFVDVTVNCEVGFNSYSPVGTYEIQVTVLRDARTEGVDALPNYIITASTGVYTVTQQLLYVTVADASKVYGTSNPQFLLDYSGWVSGDNTRMSASNFTAPTTKCYATVDSGINTTYDILLYGGYSRNYRMVWSDPTTGALTNVTEASEANAIVAAKLTVTRATFASGITFTGKSTVYNARPVSISIADQNVLPEGTTITYRDSQQGESVSYTTPRLFTNAGTYTITATLTNDNYDTKSYSASIVIGQAVPSIAARAVAKTYNGSAVSGIADVYPYYLSVSFRYSLKNNVDDNLLTGAPTSAGTYYYYAYTLGNENYKEARTAVATLTINPIEVEVSVTRNSYVTSPDAKGVEYELAQEDLRDTIAPLVKYVERTSATELTAGVIPTEAGLYDFTIISTNPNYSLYNNTGLLTVGAKMVATEDGSMTVSPSTTNTVFTSVQAQYQTILDKDLTEPSEDDENYDAIMETVKNNRLIWSQVKSAVGANYSVLTVLVADLVDESGRSVKLNPGESVEMKLLLPEGVDVSKAELMMYKEDGTVVKLDTKFENGYATFMTNSTGTFVIAEKTTPLWVWIAVGGGGFVLLVGSLAFALISNKRRQLDYANMLIERNKKVFDPEEDE